MRGQSQVQYVAVFLSCRPGRGSEDREALLYYTIHSGSVTKSEKLNSIDLRNNAARNIAWKTHEECDIKCSTTFGSLESKLTRTCQHFCINTLGLI